MKNTLAKRRNKETRTMNCGMKATIIDYRSCNDVDVQFEDKTIKNCTYGSFKKGAVQNPNLRLVSLKNERIGEVKMMNCGQKAKIIAYRGYNDIDVQFEDDFIFTSASYDSFKKGAILGNCQHTNTKSRVEEIRTMNNGQKAKIIVYNTSKNIDVEFQDEKRTVVKGRTYQQFQLGSIRNPNFNSENNGG